MSFFQHQVNSPDSLTAKNARWLYFVYNAKRNPYKLSAGDIQTFTGDYIGHKIGFQNGHLVYTSSTGYTARLIPITKTTFLLGSEFDNREMIFHRNTKGRPDRMYLNFDGNLSAIFVRD